MEGGVLQAVFCKKGHNNTYPLNIFVIWLANPSSKRVYVLSPWNWQALRLFEPIEHSRYYTVLTEV